MTDKDFLKKIQEYIDINYSWEWWEWESWYTTWEYDEVEQRVIIWESWFEVAEITTEELIENNILLI